MLTTELRTFRPALCAGLTLLFLAALWVRPACSEPTRDFSGNWDGVVIFKPAEVEVAVHVELGKAADGSWAGTIDVPVQRLKFFPLTHFRVAGQHIAFDYIDNVDTSTFHGELSADGNAITGEVLESQERHSFRLDRTRGDRKEPAPAVIHTLSPSNAELKQAFNRDSQAVRLVLVLSPTCPTCAIGAQIVERYLLDKVDSDRLRLYVVWGRMQGDEEKTHAEAASALIPDRRATHFWTDNASLAEALKGSVGLSKGKAWDVFVLFPAGSRWAEPAPVPASYMHQLPDSELPAARRLNGTRLREEVLRLLAQPERPDSGSTRSSRRAG